MTALFADTGYWIALLDPADDLHDRAVGRSMEIGDLPVVTTEFVLVELFNDFASRGPHYRRLVSAFVHGLEADGGVSVMECTHDRFRDARVRYAQRPDKEWSLTDCDSMLACEELGIREVLAYDRHFAQAGYRALLRDQDG
jgi:uncharacterized protein